MIQKLRAVYISGWARLVCLATAGNVNALEGHLGFLRRAAEKGQCLPIH